MRRPRARLVTSHPGGAGAPPGGTMAPRQELADAEPVRRFSSLRERCRGPDAKARSRRRKEDAAGGAPRGASSPIARRRGHASQSVPGGFASRPGGLANPRVCRRSAPLTGSRDGKAANPAPTKQQGRRSVGLPRVGNQKSGSAAVGKGAPLRAVPTTRTSNKLQRFRWASLRSAHPTEGLRCLRQSYSAACLAFASIWSSAETTASKVSMVEAWRAL